MSLLKQMELSGEVSVQDVGSDLFEGQPMLLEISEESSTRGPRQLYGFALIALLS
jgi:hypothetical protein